jgi:3-hydroxyisobutyrate dehydrogenase
MARIGFIGLGNMGLPMARNLLKAGHTVEGFDLDGAAVDRLVSAGGTSVVSARLAATRADAIITMLPSGREVRDVYLGDDGIVANAQSAALLIDCSTIDVATARAVAAEAERRGLAMLDAPVSGGVAGAEAATLTFMVGGRESAFVRAGPLLAAMGRTVVHTGDSGTGQAAKICNNMILGASMIAVCEAFVLADRLGLAADKLFDVASTSSGQCWSLTSYCPVPGPVPSSPANRGYKPGFTAAMMLKDLRLAQEAARTSGARASLAAEAANLYGRYVEAGHAGVDFSGIIQFLRSGK